jgi:hypothetical protein
MATLKSGGKILLAGLAALASGVIVTPPPPAPTGSFLVADNAAWCWFSDPRAVYYNGKTYITFITSTGVNMIVAYDHATDTVAGPVTIRTGMGVDDHANPAILIRDSDKRLIVFYSAHTGSGTYYKISTNPEDISSWGSEVNLDPILGKSGYSYNMPVQLLGEANDPIYLWYRYNLSGTTLWGYTWSTDGGANWSGHHSFFHVSVGHQYLKLAQNGDSRIDFVVTDGHPVETGHTSLYHFYYSAGNWYKSDGTAIAAPYYSGITNFTQIYDGSSAAGWMEDIAIDGSGNPVVLYTVYNSDTDRDYYWAKWTGSSWVSHKVADAGATIASIGTSTAYVGGASLDPTDPNIVYASVTVGGQWEIVKFTTADNGASWSQTAITTDSTAENIRPFVPANRQADLKVLWLYGTYTSYTSYLMEMLASN